MGLAKFFRSITVWMTSLIPSSGVILPSIMMSTYTSSKEFTRGLDRRIPVFECHDFAVPATAVFPDFSLPDCLHTVGFDEESVVVKKQVESSLL